MSTLAIEDSTILSRVAEIVAAEMDGETVMINIDTGKYYGIDPIGSKIWGYLAAPKTLAELVDALVAEYDVDRDHCKADVTEFLTYMSGEGLVKLG